MKTYLCKFTGTDCPVWHSGGMVGEEDPQCKECNYNAHNMYKKKEFCLISRPLDFTKPKLCNNSNYTLQLCGGYASNLYPCLDGCIHYGPKINVCLNDSSFTCHHENIADFNDSCLSNPEDCKHSKPLTKPDTTGYIKSSTEFTACNDYDPPPKDKASEDPNADSASQAKVTARDAVDELRNGLKPVLLHSGDFRDKVFANLYKIDQELKAKDARIKDLLDARTDYRKEQKAKDEKIETKNKKIWDLGREIVAKDKDKERISEIYERRIGSLKKLPKELEQMDCKIKEAPKDKASEAIKELKLVDILYEPNRAYIMDLVNTIEQGLKDEDLWIEKLTAEIEKEPQVEGKASEACNKMRTLAKKWISSTDYNLTLDSCDIIEQELKAKDEEIELITSDRNGILAIKKLQSIKDTLNN